MTSAQSGQKVEDRDPLVGQILANNFEILEPIGAGAMGRVYRARQVSLDKIVAIKVLHQHLAGDERLAKRFHREARAASRLNHPNSLQIIDFGAAGDGTLYIAMELLKGRDLGVVIKEEFPFALSRLVHITTQALSALEEAHAANIIHRDLKPENIVLVSMRGDPDFVKVCDFGIAKIQDAKGDDSNAAITVAGIVCGTPEYMSPEQARGEPLDARSDIYSMACILYELATGTRPFSAETALGVVTQHLTEPPVAPSRRRPDLPIDARLERLILRGMAKRREERFGSAGEMRYALDAVRAEAEGLPPPRTTTSTARHAAAAVIAPAVAMAQASTLMSGEIAARPRPRARWIAVGTGVGTAAIVLAIAGWALLGPRPVDRSNMGGHVQPPAGAAVRGPPPPPSAAGQAVGEGLEQIETAPAPQRVTPAIEPTEPSDRRRGSRDRGRRGGKASPAAASAPAPALPPPPAATASPLAEATSLFRAGNCRGALPLLEQARASASRDPEVYWLLGRCYARVGRGGESSTAYRRFLDLAPHSPRAEEARQLIGGP